MKTQVWTITTVIFAILFVGALAVNQLQLTGQATQSVSSQDLGKAVQKYVANRFGIDVTIKSVTDKGVVSELVMTATQNGQSQDSTMYVTNDGKYLLGSVYVYDLTEQVKTLGEYLSQYAGQVGIDTAQFEACIATDATAAKIQKDMSDGELYGVGGTPTVFVNGINPEPTGQRIPTYEQVSAAIDAELAGTSNASQKVPVSTNGAYILGQASASVTVVIFSDYECPACYSFETTMQVTPQLIQNYVSTGKAKIAFRNFPLSFHEKAQKAAEAAECAGLQGKFWEYHDKLFEDRAWTQ